MKFAKRLAPLAVLAVALAMPAIASAQAQKIGSANVQKVFTDIKETKDLESKLAAQGQALQSQQTALQQRAQSLKASRDQFKPGTDTYDKANVELKRVVNEGSISLQIANQDLLGEQKRQTKMIYDKIVAAAAELAKEKGFSVVISQIVPPEPSDDQLDKMTADQLIQMLRTQNLLYVDPASDLTAEVVTRMDAKYASTNPTPAAATPAPAATTPPAPAPAPAPAPR